jgi:oligopeptide/dipeptide ABC transporter ATP-binding protein
MIDSNLLNIQNLSVSFEGTSEEIQILQDISFGLKKGECLGIVGESGSGKSITGLALMNLLPASGRISNGKILYHNENLMNKTKKEWTRFRGSSISMVFQDPISGLDPCYTVGEQLKETLRNHGFNKNRDELKKRCLELLNQVGITDPEIRLRNYPHELSGGMAQRVMIALAISSHPEILIADEPTTALDVTIQNQVLALLRHLQKKNNMGMILISHDMGVILENTDQVVVMYAGQIMESGTTRDVILNPRHPYTKALLECLPIRNKDKSKPLPSLLGMVPKLSDRPSGCQFNPRCHYVKENCKKELPPVTESEGRRLRCFYSL